MITLKKPFFLLLILCGFTACGEDSILNPSFKVSGLITDEFTQQPLDSVLVQLHEDREGPFMGTEIIGEYTTDKTGRYSFSFDYVEGPYKISISRPRYGYINLLKGTGRFPDVYTPYRGLNTNPFKKSEEINFAMEAYGTLQVQIKNTGPASNDDMLTVHFENLRKALPKTQSQSIAGIQDQILELGTVAGNQYVRIKYTVKEGGGTRDFKDSVYVKPFVKNKFILSY